MKRIDNIPELKKKQIEPLLELEFFKPKDLNKNPKITVHKTGKLGFNISAIKMLNLHKYRFCKIGRNKSDKNDHDLYMVLTVSEEKESFKIAKTGSYYYINGHAFLKQIGIDFKDIKKKFVFDIDSFNNSLHSLKLRTEK